MNDSPYGLTASVWTDAAGSADSEAAFLRLADALQAGTVFLNRCVPHRRHTRFSGMASGKRKDAHYVAQVRLPGPGARVDRREEQRARSQSEQVRCVFLRLSLSVVSLSLRVYRLRPADAREVGAHEDQDGVSAAQRGPCVPRWSYLSRCRSGGA